MRQRECKEFPPVEATHAAETNADALLIDAAKVGDAALVAHLLTTGGATARGGDAHGETALHWAVIRCHADVVVELLRHGVDVDARNIGGMTALHFACEGRRKNVGAPRGEAAAVSARVVRCLVAAGFDIHAKDNSGATPVSVASCRIIKLALLAPIQ